MPAEPLPWEPVLLAPHPEPQDLGAEPPPRVDVRCALRARRDPGEPIPAEAERRAGIDRRAGEDRRSGWAADEAMARRLIEALGPERVAELVEFLESPADGAYLLVRDESGLLSERSISERPSRHRHSA